MKKLILFVGLKVNEFEGRAKTGLTDKNLTGIPLNTYDPHLFILVIDNLKQSNKV